MKRFRLKWGERTKRENNAMYNSIANNIKENSPRAVWCLQVCADLPLTH